RVEDLPVAARHVDRLEDEERRAEFDHPARVPRSPVEIDQAGVQRIAGIDLQERGAEEPLVGSDRSPRDSARERLPGLHLERDHPRLGRASDHGSYGDDANEQTRPDDWFRWHGPSLRAGGLPVVGSADPLAERATRLKTWVRSRAPAWR